MYGSDAKNSMEPLEFKSFVQQSKKYGELKILKPIKII